MLLGTVGAWWGHVVGRKNAHHVRRKGKRTVGFRRHNGVVSRRTVGVIRCEDNFRAARLSSLHGKVGCEHIMHHEEDICDLTSSSRTIMKSRSTGFGRNRVLRDWNLFILQGFEGAKCRICWIFSTSRETGTGARIKKLHPPGCGGCSEYLLETDV